MVVTLENPIDSHWSSRVSGWAPPSIFVVFLDEFMRLDQKKPPLFNWYGKEKNHHGDESGKPEWVLVELEGPFEKTLAGALC